MKLENDDYIFINGDTYDEIVEKIKDIGIPGFKIKDWVVKGLYEFDEDINFELPEEEIPEDEEDK